MSAVTELGGLAAVPIFAVICAGLLWWRGRRRDAALLAAAVIGSALLNTALKAVFQRARPDLWEHLVFPNGACCRSRKNSSRQECVTWCG